MGDFILIGYSEESDSFKVLGQGSLEELIKVKRSIDDLLNMKMKAVEMPKDVTLQELVSNDKLLKDKFGYLKDSMEEIEREVVQQINFNDINSSEEELF